jgi:hypothetical protein
MDKTFDRAAEDTGNIVHLEHVNTRIPDQRISTLFYVTGLGLTRDPYLMVSTNNMWINVGRSQFHLPTGAPQVVRGRTGIVMPSLDKLPKRLEAVEKQLEGTRFGFKVGNSAIEVTSPWGNRFVIHAPEERFGRMSLGIPYVELDVPEGTAEGIARFYREIFHSPASVEDGCARVPVGYRQELIYRETDAAQPDYDGHHIQVYVADFSGPHKRLQDRGLIAEESDQYQYRLLDLVDPKTGEKLFRFEHEVRSLTHPLFARPLVNRNPDESNLAYAPGHEDRSWALADPH